MAVPTYDYFIEPILRYLEEYPDGVTRRPLSPSVDPHRVLTCRVIRNHQTPQSAPPRAL